MNSGAFKIRPEESGDESAITAVNDAAFGQPNEGRLIQELQSAEGFDSGLSLVAESEDGTLVGHILFTPIRILEGETSFPSLALAPMAVMPDFQKKGIGSRLVEAGFADCRAAGHDSVIVLGHPDYYPRFGFRPASEFGIRCPFDGIPDPVFMALELTEGALRDTAGIVEYPSPFSKF